MNSVLPGPTRSEGVATFVERMAQQQGIDFATMEREFFGRHAPLAPAALRNRGRGGEHGRLRVQCRGVRDQRRGTAGRRGVVRAIP